MSGETGGMHLGTLRPCVKEREDDVLRCRGPPIKRHRCSQKYEPCARRLPKAPAHSTSSGGPSLQSAHNGALNLAGAKTGGVLLTVGEI